MSSEEQPKIKLYWLNESRSQRIVWLLEELKVDYEVEIFYRDKTTYLAPPELEKVHSLGKSPVITITPPGADAKPVVLAESGFMTQYLVEHFPEGKRLMPTQWKEGMEGKIGGETEGWLRYQYFLHYSEGSFMPILVMALIVARLRSPQVPFFVRPITSAAAGKIFSSYIFPNTQKHLRLINEHLETSDGDYLCGKTLTAADILMSFPLTAAKNELDNFGSFEGGSWKSQFPEVWNYVQRLEKEPLFIKSAEKIKDMEKKHSLAML